MALTETGVLEDTPDGPPPAGLTAGQRLRAILGGSALFRDPPHRDRIAVADGLPQNQR